jgi:hypothetical protein
LRPSELVRIVPWSPVATSRLVEGANRGLARAGITLDEHRWQRSLHPRIGSENPL